MTPKIPIGAIGWIITNSDDDQVPETEYPADLSGAADWLASLGMILFD